MMYVLFVVIASAPSEAVLLSPSSCLAFVVSRCLSGARRSLDYCGTGFFDLLVAACCCLCSSSGLALMFIGCLAIPRFVSLSASSSVWMAVSWQWSAWLVEKVLAGRVLVEAGSPLHLVVPSGGWRRGGWLWG